MVLDLGVSRDQAGRDREPSGPTLERAADPSAELAPVFTRELTLRLAAEATPEELARWMRLHLHGPVLAQGRTWLEVHARSRLPRTYLAQLDEQLARAPAQALSGAMLVSNNPEGLNTGGKIMTTNVEAGKLAAYIHHSNHAKQAMNLFLVFRPAPGKQFSVSGHGASASTSSYDFAHDPNVAVADAIQESGGKQVPTIGGDHAKAMPLGAIRPKHDKETTEPLLDARYDLDVVGDVTVDVVAVAGSPKADLALATTKQATGNTKYQSATSNGRASGIYTGANLASDETVRVSELQPRFQQILTGGRGAAAPSPHLSTAAVHPVVTAEQAAKTIADGKGNPDLAAALLLETHLRISREWLQEKRVWNPLTQALTLDDGAVKDGKSIKVDRLTPDYMEVLRRVVASVSDRSGAQAASAINQLQGRTSATGDFASYGTVIDATYLLHNDTDGRAALHVDFISDLRVHEAERARLAQGTLASKDANKAGERFRAHVQVDGKETKVESDSEAGLRSSTEVAQRAIEPGASQFLHVRYMSPGQISAGQAIEIHGKGGKLDGGELPQADPKVPPRSPVDEA